VLVPVPLCPRNTINCIWLSLADGITISGSLLTSKFDKILRGFGQEKKINQLMEIYSKETLLEDHGISV
jgi:hypothetical protein